MTRLLLLAPLAAALLLPACTSDTTPRPVSVSAASKAAVGIERVLRQDARTLTGLFGPPALDVREGRARKLQWRGPCVLDAYLYPPEGGGEPIATWIDARTGNGADIDRASCVAELAQPQGAIVRR